MDATLWFILHDFAKDTSTQTPTGSLLQRGAYLMDKLRFLPLTSNSNSGSEDNNQRSMRHVDNAAVVEEEASMDIDLTPQLNIALRQEMLHFVTVGIQEGVKRRGELASGQDSHSFLLDGRYKFTDYRGNDFHEMRIRKGISEEQYLKQVRCVRERV